MATLNPRVTQIAINANTGLMTNIPLTMMASKVLVMEDPSVNNGVPQGLQGYYIDTQPPQPTIPVENPVAPPPQATPQALQVWLPQTSGQQGPAYQPIILGGQDGRVHGGEGEYVGAEYTVVLQLQSYTETATQVLLYEWA